MAGGVVELEFFECYVQLTNYLGDILVAKCQSLIIGECRPFPIVAEALLEQFVYTGEIHWKSI